MGNTNQSLPSTPLENHLQTILEQTDKQIWTIRELFEVLKGKGYPFVIIILSLPFCQPIQIPGFSTPFGIVLVFVGLRMAFGKRVWWPEWVLNLKISPKLLKSVVKKSLAFFSFLKPLLHPRMSWLCTTPRLYHLHGIFVVIMAIYLALPLPIPLSNILAAWSLFLLGLGLIEEDGIFVCIAYIIGIITIAIFLVLVLWLRAWVTS